MIALLEGLSNVARGPGDGERILLLLNAYFDESYGADYYAMAGFAGTEADWHPVWGAWDACLVRHGITAFHAVDCAHGQGPQFVGMKKADRDALYLELVNILAGPEGRGLIGHAAVIPLAGFRAMLAKEGHNLPEELRDPYFTAFDFCVHGICSDKAISDRPLNEKVAFYFDQNQEMWERATQFYQSLVSGKGKVIAQFRERLAQSCTFASKKVVKPLQAADLMAYEYYRYRVEGDATSAAYRILEARFGGGWTWAGIGDASEEDGG